MKKTLLLGAVALMASTAMAQVSEPTLTSLFVNTTSIPASRYGTGYNGKVYTSETGKIYQWENANNATTFSIDTYGNAAIATDEAGNIILNQGLWGTGATNWCIVSATDKTQTPFTITVPEGLTSGYVHQIGSVVGNVLSEKGGYMAFAYNNATKAIVVKIAKGEVVNTYVSTELNTEVFAAYSNAGIVVPALSTVEEYEAVDNPANHIYWRKRTVGNIYYFNDNLETKYFPLPAEAQANGEGFDVFTLNNVTYAVYPYKATEPKSSYGDGFLIANLKTGETILTQESPVNASSGKYYGSLDAQVINGTTAYIYHYSNATCAAAYKFEVPNNDPTAIEVIEAENAPVEYYNLQGVKVANPEKGLFIKKQGNKATKVVL